MIPNQWYIVMDSKSLKKGKPVAIKRFGEKLVLWRTSDGALACLHDQCLHRGAALSAGKIVSDQVQCPFHGLEFAPDGRCTSIPSYGTSGIIPTAFKARSYPAADAYGWVWLYWGTRSETLPDIRYLDAIGEEFAYNTFSDHWPAHYSRVIENQLDPIHLPFVHHNTIGRGEKYIVDGPLVEFAPSDPNLMNIWVQNRPDDGTPPLKPSHMPKPDRTPSLQFRFPNVWQNWIAPDMRIVIAFVPVDDRSTILYMRYYQNITHFPGLKHILHFFGKVGSYVIERQDRRVVLTQRPLRTHRRMGEILLRGDAPIIAYRRRREALIQAARTN